VHRRWVAAAALGAPASIGTAALLLVGRHGAYTSPDSAFYVGVARSLVDGVGLVAPPGSPPLAHFPPLFPWLLAGAGRVLGLDPMDAAAIVNPLLFGATALLVAVVVRARTGSVAAGAGASAGAVVGLDLLVYGGSALSEPLFVLLALGSLAALAGSVSRRSDRLLVAAATLAGAACLTRYVGAALVVGGAAGLWHVEHGRRRWRAVAFAAVAVLPLLVWVAAVGRTNRPVAFHWFDLGYWSTGLGSLARWVLPPFVPWPIRLAALAAMAVVAQRLVRGTAGGEGRPDPLPFLIATFTACYLALLLGDRLVVDDTGRLDARFLAPLHVLALVVLVPAAARAVAAGGAGRLTATRLRVGAVALLGLHGLQAITWVASGIGDTGVDRRGLSARAWRESAVLAGVAALPPDTAVYSNAAEAVFLLTGRRTSSVPPHHDYLSGAPDPRYDESMRAMGGRLRAGGGVVVYFAPFEFRSRFLPTAAEVGRAVPLRVVATDAVATLYRAAATTASPAGSQAARSASRRSLENTSTSG